MIRLTTLGRLDLIGSEGQVVQSVLQQPKRLALLVYLVVEGDGGFVRRDTLLGLFWPAYGEERARNALNQAVHYLRRSLGRGVVIRRSPSELGIADGAIEADAVAFARRLDDGDGAEGLALYHGDFLPGVYIDDSPEFERWLERTRARLSSRAARAAWRLADDEIAAGNPTDAIQWARRAVGYAPFDEPATRRLMRMLDDIGDRAGALQVFDRFERRLAGQLDAVPAEETLALAAAIRSSAEAGETPDPTDADHGAGSGAAGPATEDAAPDADDITPIRPAAGSSGERDEVTDTAARRSPFGRLATAALVIVVAVVIWTLSLGTPAQPPARADDGPTRIGVLRFEDHSPEGALGYLADALTTTLIEQLADVPVLEVVARDRSSPGGRSTGLESADEQLDVDLLVSGSVIRSDSTVRVSAQLVDARSGATLEAFPVERTMGNLFSLIDGVSQEVSSALRIRLGREIQLERWRSGTDDVAAWEMLQRAQWYRDRASELQWSGSFESAEMALRTADSLLARAEDLDADWIEPIVLRGYTAEKLGWLFFVPPLRESGRFRDAWVRGVAHATRAIRLSPNDAAAVELRGVLRYLLWLFAPADSAGSLMSQAQRDLQRAVALDGTRARAWSRLSSILFAQGEFSEANLAAARAYSTDAFLDNVHEILARLVVTSLELGNETAARRWCDELRDRAEQGFLSALCRLNILARSNAVDSVRVPAVWAIVDGVRLPSHLQAAVRPQLELLAATVLARIGLADSARAVIDRAAARADGVELLLYEAMARTSLGQEDHAVRLLRRYVDARPTLHAGLLKSRVFNRLRDRPDFPNFQGSELSTDNRTPP